MNIDLPPQMVRSMEDWKRVLTYSEQERAQHLTDKKVERIYGPVRSRQEQEYGLF